MSAAVDVIVPAHNAEETIGATLEALSQQEVAPSEIVVVDDRSADSTAELASGGGARVLPTSSQLGPAEARNLGAAETSSEVLAFTDADCRPDPAWLRAALAEIEAGADLVTGPIEPVRPPGPFDRTLSVSGPSPLFESANVVVRREMYERVGGFRRPQALALAAEGEHFGEDVVFAWECIEAGAVVAFAPEARVRHEVFPRGPAGYIREAWRLRLFPPLVAEVPGLASRLPLRLFLSRKTALFDLAVAGVAVAARSRRAAPLALGIPYAAFRFSAGRPTPGKLRQDAAFLGADIVGLAALIYGSARARRPLL